MRLGSFGPLVGKLHQALIESGATVAADELDLEVYGTSTDTAVRAFQQRSGLAVDGIAGPHTLQALEAPGDYRYIDRDWRCRPSDVRAAVRPVIIAAVNDIGLRESPDGSNDGPQLAKFNTRGTPWCAWAASAWMAHADGGSPFGRIGSVWALRDWCEQRGKLVTVPEPGDLAMVLRAQRRGHVALVVHVEGNSVHCCEGNSRNAVRATVRIREAFTVYGRPL
jgi:hypothetical protein